MDLAFGTHDDHATYRNRHIPFFVAACTVDLLDWRVRMHLLGFLGYGLWDLLDCGRM